MTKEEIKKKIDEYESDRFFLAMKDNWTGDDFERDRQYLIRIKELKKQLEEVEA